MYGILRDLNYLHIYDMLLEDMIQLLMLGISGGSELVVCTVSLEMI